MSIATILVQDDGLTLGEILSDIPHDLPAIVVYVLIAAFVGFVWWGSRGGDKAGGARPGSDTKPS